MEKTEHNESNDVYFNSWLLDKHQKVEQTAGVGVLFIETLDIVIHRIFHRAPEVLVTQLLNLGFLIFIYIQLENEFRKRYTLNDKDHKKIATILRIWRYTGEHKQERIDELVRSSNKLIGQLHNINKFILATAALYFLFLVKLGVSSDKHNIFHFLFDFITYVGAFYLLRCFYVMYLPTVEEGRDVLREKTKRYIFIIFGLMVIDFSLTTFIPNTGAFITEFICGEVMAVVFVLLVARFQNKILDIPPYILFILYAYAVLQTCLPFVTNTGLVLDPKFSANFSLVVFILVLVGKLALAAMLLYVLKSGRIVYYFMFMKNLHEEEKKEKHWEEFKGLLNELPRTPEPFEIIYEYDSDSTGCTAKIVPTSLFGSISGSGKTLGEARDNLLDKIQAAKNP